MLDGDGPSHEKAGLGKIPQNLLDLIPFKTDKDKLLRFEAHYLEE